VSNISLRDPSSPKAASGTRPAAWMIGKASSRIRPLGTAMTRVSWLMENPANVDLNIRRGFYTVLRRATTLPQCTQAGAVGKGSANILLINIYYLQSYLLQCSA